MKIRLVIAAFVACLQLAAIGQNQAPYQVQCVTQDADGNITFRIWNPKAGKRYKQETALKEGIHAILFSGLSGAGTCQGQPALLKTSSEQENFRKIEEEFFSKDGRWRNFARQGDVGSASLEDTATKDMMVYIVRIARNDLRKYLEEQQIIKRLNNGF